VYPLMYLSGYVEHFRSIGGDRKAVICARIAFFCAVKGLSLLGSEETKDSLEQLYESLGYS
jgi:hypothetical protein